MLQFILKLIPFAQGDTFTSILILIIMVYGIVSFALLRKKLNLITSNIKILIQNLSKFNNRATEEFENIKDMFLSNALIKDEWIEYENTLIKREHPRKIYKTEPAEIYFNDIRILSKKMNIRYWSELPGIFIGLGILGTFLGLTYGLSSFNTGSSEKIQESIQGLLSGMTTAFATSVWGIGISILFNIYEKWEFNNLSSAIMDLAKRLNRLFTLTNHEEIAIKQQEQLEVQTAALKSFSTDLADRIKIAMDSVMASRFDKLQQAIERLYEESEQSTKIIIEEIKKSGHYISEGLKESVGSIMIEKLSPALESVGDSINNLVPVVESLKEEKQSSIIDSINKLVEEFRASLTSSIQTEINSLATIIGEAGQSLKLFPQFLDNMMAALNEQSQHVKEMMEKTAKNISENLMEDAAASISLMREEAEISINKFSQVISNLQENINQILKRQESNAQVYENFLKSSGSILQQGNILSKNLDEALKSIIESTDHLNKTSEDFKTSSESVRESIETLQIVIKELQEQGESYIKANNETLNNLRLSLNESEKLIEEYAMKFNIIEEGLNNIFEEIQDGINQYTNATRENLNKYLAEFADHLSDAAQRLAGTVEYLAETINDLEDIFSKIKK